jgi:hypothetical protein
MGLSSSPSQNMPAITAFPTQAGIWLIHPTSASLLPDRGQRFFCDLIEHGEIQLPLHVFSGNLPVQPLKFWPLFFRPVGSCERNITLRDRISSIAQVTNLFESHQWSDTDLCIGMCWSNFEQVKRIIAQHGEVLMSQHPELNRYSRSATKKGYNIIVRGTYKRLPDVEIRYGMVLLYLLKHPKHIKLWHTPYTTTLPKSTKQRHFLCYTSNQDMPSEWIAIAERLGQHLGHDFVVTQLGPV